MRVTGPVQAQWGGERRRETGARVLTAAAAPAACAGVSEEDWKQRESEEMKRMREQLEQAQKLLQDENKTWEEKEADAKNGAAKRAAALQNMVRRRAGGRRG